MVIAELFEWVLAACFLYVMFTQVLVPIFKNQPIFPKLRKAPTEQVEKEIKQSEEELEAERLKDRQAALTQKIKTKRSQRGA